MKPAKLLTALLLLLSLPGCISEDRDDCLAGYTALLTFEYSSLNGGLFVDNITTVDLLFFDGSGKYLMREIATEEMLRAFPGIYLSLAPGTYYVVAWGNRGSNTSIGELTEGLTDFADGYIEIASSATSTGDKVYYAPGKASPGTRSAGTRAGDMSLYRIDIPRGEVITKTLSFVRAHRTVNVYVKGLDAAGGISIEARNLWAGYDFFFTNRDRRCGFFQNSAPVQIDGATYYAATFHSAMGAIQPDMDFDILRGTTRGDVAMTVNLQQFLQTHTVANTDEIDILVEFHDLGVTIGVPNWGQKPVQPGV